MNAHNHGTEEGLGVACPERPVGQCLRDEHDELQATFDLRWDADMRAIKMWQAAHPGKELVWPDHGDLVVWLLEELDKARRHIASIE